MSKSNYFKTYQRPFPMIPKAQMIGTSTLRRKYRMYVMLGFMFSRTFAPSVTFIESVKT